MTIKTMLNLGDTFGDKNQYTVFRIGLDNIEELLSGKKKYGTVDYNACALGEDGPEFVWTAERIKNPFLKMNIQEATEAINKAAIHNLKPDEDDFYMETLADKAYAEEDLRDLDRRLTSMCKNWEDTREQETDPLERAKNYGIWNGLILAKMELEILITNLGHHTRKLRNEMRGQDEEVKT